jgi:hypothetical protein
MSKREEYFRKFPLITYRGVTATNILKRISFTDNSLRKSVNNFYEHSISENESIQQIAFDYYDDVDLDWLIYLANDVIDPYYDVPFNYEQFEKFIKTKYGSIEKAQKKIFNYRTNYQAATDAGESITVGAYNSFPGSIKKYWAPLKTALGTVGYERDKTDIYASTNKIISLQYVTEQTSVFNINENVYIQNDTASRATVAGVTSTEVILKHINGGFDRNSNFTLIGEDSKVSIEMQFDEYKLIQQVIPIEEEIYFKQYTAYDYEADINESKRNISLVQSSIAQNLNDDLTRILK